MVRLKIILNFGRVGKMIKERLQITFEDDSVVIKTLDQQDGPIQIWIFDKEKLSDNNKIFIDNILSMTTTMISEKTNPDCKCKECKCDKK